MEFRYRDGDTKDPAHLQPTASLLDVSLRRQPRPIPTESAQQAQLQYSSISHPQLRPTELPYRLRNEKFLQSSSSTIGVLVDSTSKETGRPVIRRPVPALASLQRGINSREIGRPLHVLHHPMSILGHMQRRETEKERIRRELREQIRGEMVEKEQRQYAEMRRVLEEEVRQELDMEWARRVGQPPLITQPPHQPVLSTEMGETMGNSQLSMDEQLSVTIRPSPQVTPSPDFPTEPFQLQMQAGDEHVTTSQVNHIAVSRNELALVHSDDNFKKGEHIAEQRIVDEELWTEEQLCFLRPLPANVRNEELWTEEQLPFLRPLPANVQDKVEHHSVLQDSPIVVVGNELTLIESHNDVDTNDIIAKAKMSNWETPGIKRYGLGIMESGSKKLRTGDESWTCAVCQVTVTSEKHLHSHLQGKKHKTRVEKFTLEETLIKKSEESSASKPDNTPKPTLLQAQDGEKVTMEVDGKSHKVIIKRDSVWCKPCMAVCNTREMMVIHLKGKKHIQRMKKLNITEDGAN